MDRSKLLTTGAIVLILVLYVGFRMSQEPGSPPAPTDAADMAAKQAADDGAPPVSSPAAGSGKLEKKDLKVGTGATATPGKLVTVHYRGTLTNGTKFDASYDRGEPFQFTLGAGQVIKGWDQGVAGMKVGGRRKLTIPSELGYGERGGGEKIPPNATLVFEIELLGVS